MKKFIYLLSLFSILTCLCTRVYADNEDKVLVSNLKGIAIWSDSDKADGLSRDWKYVGVKVQSASVPEGSGLVGKLNKYIDRPVTLQTLQDVRGSVVEYYRMRGYPLVHVNIPTNQSISKGYMNIVIVVSKLGDVKVNSKDPYTRKKVRDEITLNKGDRIRSAALVADLEWLNNNPYRSVNLLYERGSGYGETDIVLDVKDKFPLKVFGGYQYTPNLIAGDSRWIVGLNAGEMWWQNHQLNVQFMTANNVNEWWSLSGNYIAPLPWRNIIKVYGGYTEAQPQQSAVQKVKGRNWSIGTRYIVPIPQFWTINMKFAFGYDFKNTNNFLSIIQGLVLKNYVDVSQFFMGFDGTVVDSYGQTFFGVGGTYSPGGMTENNTTKDFQNERAGADAAYGYFRFNLDRYTSLPFGMMWGFNALLQLSTGKLLPSEEMSLGGYLTVRGYNENEVVADRGFLMKNDLRTPPIRPLYWSGFTSMKDNLQFLVFIDFAWGEQIDPVLLNRNEQVLASVGPGVRYSINGNFNFFLDYGFQMNPITDRFRAGRDTSALNLGATLSF